MEESRTAVTAALLGNAALALLKGTSAVFTGSAAMLAETFHSIADTGNQTLLFLGMRLARRPPDEAHPFGHGFRVGARIGYAARNQSVAGITGGANAMVDF